MNAPVVTTKQHLFVSTAIAIGVAAIILVAVVLPAEYAIDPLRTGRLLGLDAMGESKRNSAVRAEADARAGSAEAMHSHAKKFYTSRVEINIKGREELEYKAELAVGEPLLYTWSVMGGEVYYQFHGEPTAGDWPKDYFRSYQIGERSSQESGSFVAPFTGRHGWYWRNLSDQPITIVLEAHGYYTKLARIGGAMATP